jgi:hypothetical protein
MKLRLLQCQRISDLVAETLSLISQSADFCLNLTGLKHEVVVSVLSYFIFERGEVRSFYCVLLEI